MQDITSPVVELLLQNPAGYTAACVNALADQVRTRCYVYTPQVDTNFSARDLFSTHVELREWGSEDRPMPDLATDEPRLLVVAGWRTRPYLDRARQLEGRSKRVLLMDNQWRGTARQRLASMGRRWLIGPYFDAAFVPGRRQSELAVRLGIPSDRVKTGALACDSSVFNVESAKRGSAFLYVGRLVERKGVRDLLGAYRAYREESPEPRRLVIVGDGPLVDAAAVVPGVALVSFADSWRVRQTMQDACCLILPSHFEPWGVVLHEAASMGLPIIATRACGASDEFVNDMNGFILETGDTAGLASAMSIIDGWPDRRWQRASAESLSLSSKFSINGWVNTVIDML